MNEISVKKGRRPVFLVVAAAVAYLGRYVWAPFIYVSIVLLVLSVIFYWSSCRCPVCRTWLKVWEVMESGKVYQCPHCHNDLKVVE